MAGMTEYSQEIADAICDLIADGKSLRSICEVEEMPNKSTVFKWLRQQPDFSDQYARAREAQADAFFDELLEISDDASDDISGELGMPNGVAVQRAKLRVDTRKWAMGKMQPKKYGERLDLNHSGSIATTLSDEELNAKLAALGVDVTNGSQED